MHQCKVHFETLRFHVGVCIDDTDWNTQLKQFQELYYHITVVCWFRKVLPQNSCRNHSSVAGYGEVLTELLRSKQYTRFKCVSACDGERKAKKVRRNESTGEENAS